MEIGDGLAGEVAGAVAEFLLEAIGGLF